MDLIDSLSHALSIHGVEAVFHLPGSATVPLYASLDEVRPVLMRHPASVGFAAEAYARLRGLGVAIVAQGPGIAGIIPALIHSWKDHVAVVAITARPSYMVGDPGAWQAFPLREVLGPVVKGYYEVGKDKPEALLEAFSLAAVPPSGPVVVNIIEDGMGTGPVVGTRPASQAGLSSVSPAFAERLVEALEDASYPLILAGAGALKDGRDLAEAVQRLQIPIVTTAPARGAVDEMDPLCLGPVGTIGFESANSALSKADLILALGSRLSHNTIKPLVDANADPAIFQVNGDPMDRSHIVSLDRYQTATVSSALQALQAIPGASAIDSRPRWWKPSTARGPPPSPSLRAALEAVDLDSVLVMDAGTAGLAVYRSFCCRKPYHMLYPWGIATMGSSLAQAVGACHASARRAVAVCGDGGLLASLPELSTIAEGCLPVKVVVFNNGGLQFIREISRRVLGKEVDMSFGPEDLASIAQALGTRSERVDGSAALSAYANACLRDSEPFLLEVVEEGRPLDLRGTQWGAKASRENGNICLPDQVDISVGVST
ncbi:MAG: thiamine pyrophosphate-binding protein [Methanotrichaceae archaeon]|nr:thiamine pyrophosphate-binding protein [Methanotrichaceae archaeon]